MIKKTRKLPDNKDKTKNLPTIRHVDPEYVYLPITNMRCPVGEPCVDEGDYVKVGQIIGTRTSNLFEQPIHATVSGEIVAHAKKFTVTGKLLDCIVIKNDKKEVLHDRCKPRTDEEIARLTRQDYSDIFKENSLVGLGGSGFPTHVKFGSDIPIHTIVINGVECEPYLTSDYRLMIEMADNLIQGIVYAMDAADTKKAVIAIKDKYEEPFQALSKALEKFPDRDIQIKRLKNVYPQGWEIDTIKAATGIRVPIGTLPAKYGVLTLNVATIISIYNAVKSNLPVLKRYFTVSGDGVKEPKNFRVRVGTSVQELIELCGGYFDNTDKVFILGGPMMGTSLVRDDAITSKTTTSLLVFNKKEFKEEPCIRCAACVYSCPVGIQPVQIMNATKRKDKDALMSLDVNKCMECGLCSYVCPSKIHLTEWMRKGKKLIQ